MRGVELNKRADLLSERPGARSQAQRRSPRRLGRPPKSAASRRGNRVVTMVTDADFARLVSHAEANGASLSATVQKILAKFLSEQQR